MANGISVLVMSLHQVHSSYSYQSRHSEFVSASNPSIYQNGFHQVTPKTIGNIIDGIDGSGNDEIGLFPFGDGAELALQFHRESTVNSNRIDGLFW